MTTETPVRPQQIVEELDRVTIRFAGDSGDGMQLTGTQFTKTSAVFGNDIATLPDFPAEIRAPTGSLPGVSGFQLSFSSNDIRTPGDQPDALVAMNPAALKVNVGDLRPGGLLIVDEDEFTPVNLKKAAYTTNPLEDGSLGAYQLIKIRITRQNELALEGVALDAKAKFRSRNFYALGLVLWLYGRPLEGTIKWATQQFRRNPAVLDGNLRALHAGHAFGETTELFRARYEVAPAKVEPGTYRFITGNEATALGFVAASVQSGLPLFYGSYPITPASDVLHELSKLKQFGIKTFQAEDEIAAIGSALGAAYGGHLALTGTSGPGLSLKSEMLNLAVMTELPLVVIDVQRAGPSTGMPTKTEQSDLLQAMYGRNGECPVAIIAPQSPGDCFDMAFEAVRIATEFMVPTFLLSDGYIANGAEPWAIPDVNKLPKIKIVHPTEPNSTEGKLHENGTDEPGKFLPYKRNPMLVRPWAIPGTPGLEHRIGGIEKQDITGNVNYEPANHEHMVHTRAQKVANIAQTIPDLAIEGDQEGELLLIGWGGTYGSIATALQRARRKGTKIGQVHFRYLNPFPKNTAEVFKRFKKFLVPELNSGQLLLLLRAMFLIDAKGLNKVQGRPFLVSEIEEAIERALAGG